MNAVAERTLRVPHLGKIVKGAFAALVSFSVLGTVSALWKNSFFTRMTPTGGWEIGLLAVFSLLLGIYVAIQRPFCSIRSASAGTVVGFLGVACPVCNKVLLLVFGGQLLLTYYEPVRIYVAALGVLIMLVTLAREWKLVRELAGGEPPGGVEARRATAQAGP